MEIKFKTIIEEIYDFELDRERLISLLDEFCDNVYVIKNSSFSILKENIYEENDYAIAIYESPNGKKYLCEDLNMRTNKAYSDTTRIIINGTRRVYPVVADYIKALLDEKNNSDDITKILYFISQYKYYTELNPNESIFDVELLCKYYEELISILNNSLKLREEISESNKLGRFLRPERV